MDVPQLIETSLVTVAIGTVLGCLNYKSNTESDFAILGYLSCSFLLILLHQVAPLFHENPAQRHGGIYRTAKCQGLWCAVLIPCICILAELKDDSLTINTELLFMLLTLCLTLVHYNPTNASQIAGALLLVWLKEIIKQQDLNSIRLLVFYSIFYYTLLSRLPEKFPKSFSYGESTVVIQTSLLLLYKFTSDVFEKSEDIVHLSNTTEELLMMKVAMLSILGIVLATTLLFLLKQYSFRWKFYLVYVIAISLCVVFGLPGQNPVKILLKYLIQDSTRLYLIGWCVFLTFITIIFTVYQTSISTVTRKVFHLITIAIFVPSLLVDPTFIFISSLLAFCVLVIIETIRYMEVPPFGNAIKQKYQLFIDRQDEGPLALTPLYLLIGLSLPLWLSYILNIQSNQICVFAGVLSVGVGDAMASVIGSKFGRFKLPGTSKTLEGTLGSFLSQMCFLYCVELIGGIDISWTIQLVMSIMITTLLETTTSQIDNLVLPLFLFTLLIIKL